VLVAVHRFGEPIQCGEIVFDALGGRGEFTYAPSYDGPPLDAINLDYRRVGNRRFTVDPIANPDLLHRVFSDYMPGSWGLHVLQGKHPEIRSMVAAERLHWFGSRTVGALSFYVERLSDESPLRGINVLEDVRRKSVDLYLSRTPKLTSRGRVIGGLTSHGGARPKALFEDTGGEFWIAKFNSPESDPYNFARIENALTKMAIASGIDAVDTRFIEVPDGHDVLLVRRFDRTPGKRPHKISAFSLLGDAVKNRSDGDYELLFGLVKRLCLNPEQQRDELFRRMLFNLAINNTDDHLKNFEFLMDVETGDHVLAPCFDLTCDPYPNPRSSAVFGDRNASISRDDVLDVARRIDMDCSQALSIRERILDVAAQWEQFFSDYFVSEDDIGRMRKMFARSLS
jgi:hypothetical protein